MNKTLLAACFILLRATVLTVLGQSSTSVEHLGSVSSTSIKNGLGFNMTNLNNQWEFQMAAAAGSTEARFQPGWSNMQNMAGVFNMPTSTETALNWCTQYGIAPLLVAAYGGPYQSIGNFTVAQAYPAGVYAIQLNQSVAGVVFPYCHVMTGSNTQIVSTGKWGYYGGLITQSDTSTNTITLSSTTCVPLAAGQTLIINKLLYPSCATASATDASIVAYGASVAYMGTRIAAHGLTGRIEIWNEPPWAHDPWDHRGAFYDTPPVGVTTTSPNFGLAENLAPTTAAAGVHYNWAGTNKSGTRSVLNTGYMSPALTAANVANSISCEAWHPYGNCPEDDNWDATMLTSTTVSAYTTLFPGGNITSNFVSGRQLLLKNPSLGFKQNITETGLYTYDNSKRARFIMRQYLAYLGDGLERVTFYCFATPGASGSTVQSYGFVDQTTEAPTQSYTAIQGLVVTDMANIPVAPLSYTSANLPAVPSYHGTYPLSTVSIVGRHAATDTVNTIYYVVWQRSHVPPGPVTNLSVASTTGHVTLNWSPNGYATGVSVRRATTSGGPYSTIGSYQSYPTSAYTDTAVTNGTTYYYVVTGSNPAGSSSNSNEVSAVPVASGSGAVNNDTVDAGPAQASWTTLVSPPAANVTAQLPAGYTATGAWDLVTRAAVTVTLSGSTATYPVSDNPVCLAVTPLVPPSGLTATAFSESQIQLAWMNNTSAATAITLQRSLHNANSWTTLSATLDPTTTSYLDGNLNASTGYDYQIQCTNAGNASAFVGVTASTPAGIGDGIPGWWRLEYFGNGLTVTPASAANADVDGSGFTNLQDYLAGTDPTNANTALRITQILQSGANINISFLSVSGKAYVLEKSVVLGSAASWSTVQDNIAGTGGIVTITDQGAIVQPRQFYRVRLK